MRRTLLVLALLCALLTAPAAAMEGQAYVIGGVNLRTGPAREYPTVKVLRAGTLVDVYGCLEDSTWCDVSWGDFRGWAYARYLAYDYRGRRVVILGYGPELWLPIVTFKPALSRHAGTD